jgi:hypothetical protein
MPRRTPDQGVRPFEVRAGIGTPKLGGMYRAGDPATIPLHKHHLIVNGRITPEGTISRPGLRQEFDTGVRECIDGLTETPSDTEISGILVWPGTNATFALLRDGEQDYYGSVSLDFASTGDWVLLGQDAWNNVGVFPFRFQQKWCAILYNVAWYDPIANVTVYADAICELVLPQGPKAVWNQFTETEPDPTFGTIRIISFLPAPDDTHDYEYYKPIVLTHRADDLLTGREELRETLYFLRYAIVLPAVDLDGVELMKFDGVTLDVELTYENVDNEWAIANVYPDGIGGLIAISASPGPGAPVDWGQYPPVIGPHWYSFDWPVLWGKYRDEDGVWQTLDFDDDPLKPVHIVPNYPWAAGTPDFTDHQGATYIGASNVMTMPSGIFTGLTMICPSLFKRNGSTIELAAHTLAGAEFYYGQPNQHVGNQHLVIFQTAFYYMTYTHGFASTQWSLFESRGDTDGDQTFVMRLNSNQDYPAALTWIQEAQGRLLCGGYWWEDAPPETGVDQVGHAVIELVPTAASSNIVYVDDPGLPRVTELSYGLIGAAATSAGSSDDEDLIALIQGGA